MHVDECIDTRNRESIMKAKDVMHRAFSVVLPSDRISYAAELMHYDVDACLPVVRDRLKPVLVGIITARDIAVRCVARCHALTCVVGDHMTPMPLVMAMPDDDLATLLHRMEDSEIRRVPVVDADGALVGVIREIDLGHTLHDRDVHARKIGAPTELRLHAQMSM
jgi:CBS domain-containing protein